MLSYEVRVEIRKDLGAAFERYMRGRHLPEILATGCFQAIRFERSEGGAFRSRYEAASREDLDRYLADHAPQLRADFLAHFPDGCAVSREVLELVEAFS